jgi:brefeldin A-resistance guanine nucleotide exchange factor 1
VSEINHDLAPKLISRQNEAGESLKNVILVMHSSTLLLPPPAAGEDTRTVNQQNLWKASAERIERILPGFIAESIPAECVPETSGSAPSAATKKFSEAERK